MKNPKNICNHLEFIEAMKTLIEEYKNAIKAGVSLNDGSPRECPLCVLSRRVSRFNSACVVCPWEIIADNYCHSSIYDNDNPKVMRRRIKQLYNWIRIYQKDYDLKNTRKVENGP